MVEDETVKNGIVKVIGLKGKKKTHLTLNGCQILWGHQFSIPK